MTRENWTDIHEDFGKKDYSYPYKTNQQKWEEKGLTYQDAKEWIPIGLEPSNHDFVAYLRCKGYQPSPDLHLKKLRKEFNAWLKKTKPTQEYLNAIYPQEKRVQINKLNIEGKINGSLDLRDFKNLVELHCHVNEISSLDVSNCRDLTELHCQGNRLTSINFLTQLLYPEKLAVLNLNSNSIRTTDLEFLVFFVALEELRLGNYLELEINQGIYNRFTGSLEPLKNLTKLKQLDISNTDIDDGLEYLPESVEYFSCSVGKREDAKVKVLEEKLKNYGNPKGGNFVYLLRTWKKFNFQSFQQARITALETQLIILQNQLNDKEKELTQLKEKTKQFQRKFKTELNQLDQDNSTIIQRTGERLKENKRKRKDLETQLTDIQEQFQTKQAEIEQLRTEINAKQVLIETYSSNQELVAQLEAEKSQLETQLTIKREQFVFLQEENQKLIRKCYSHLKIIEDFKKNQASVDRIKNAIKRGDFTLVDTLCQKQAELTKLELKIEKIVEEEKPILKKKLKMDNENWEEKLVLGINDLTISQLEDQAQQVIQQLQIQLKEKTRQVSAVLEYQIAEKQEQLTNLLTSANFVPSAQERIVLIQEEIRILQEQLAKAGSTEQQARILHQPYGFSGFSKNN